MKRAPKVPDALRRKAALRNAAAAAAPVAVLQQAAAPSEGHHEPAGAGAHYVFIAYARQDAEIARSLVDALRAAGIAVQWDQDIRGGGNFRTWIATTLAGARAVVAIWSPAAAASDFVIDEARSGQVAGKLVTTRVPGFADRDIPLGFGSLRCECVDDLEHILQSLAALGVVPA